MADFLSVKPVAVVSCNGIKLVFWYWIAIKEDVVSVAAFDNDVNVMPVNANMSWIQVVERVEGKLIDALLDRGNPNHTRCTLSKLVVLGRVIQVNGASACGFDEIGCFWHPEAYEFVGTKGSVRLAVDLDFVVVGGRDDFYIVFVHSTQRGCHHELFSPCLDRHGLFEDAVGVVTAISGNHGQGVSVEYGNLFAVMGSDSAATEVATGC